MTVRHQRRIRRAWLSILMLLCLLTGCGTGNLSADSSKEPVEGTEHAETIIPKDEITELEDGLSTVRYAGDYGFDGFLAQGGAASDGEVVQYLADNLMDGLDLRDLLGGIFGCSTLAVKSPSGEVLFGRNFDWENCEAMVVAAYPENGYASISTVNLDFITQSVSEMVLRLDQVKTLAALYAPLDGMNEEGLAVSVNMIQDSADIRQDTGKPDLTTTTAIRLLLDKAANVDEALGLLAQYDLHGSMGMMIHFAIADAAGRSVAVEYVNNEMIVIETPVLTNFYLAQGDKQGIGTEESHQRYEALTGLLKETPAMDETQIRDALDSVSKDNYGGFASTEWSVVMNLSSGEVRYYHREDYDRSYVFQLGGTEEEGTE